MIMNRPGFQRLATGLLTIALLATASQAIAQTAGVRDEANMFSQAALTQAEARLKELRSKSGLPVTIQTRPGAQGQDPGKYAIQQAKIYAGSGLYVLILKDDRKIEVLWSSIFNGRITNDDKDKIRGAIGAEFKKQNFDEGLSKGLDAITALCMRFPPGKVAAAPKPAPPQNLPLNQPGTSPAPAPNFVPVNQAAPAKPSGSAGGIILIIFLGLGFLILIAVIRSISSARSYSAGMPPRGGPGQSAYGPGAQGYGPGYGGGGGGGGFFQGMLGGLGGAILGNWAYNRLGGHGHHDYSQGSMTGMGQGGWGSPQIDPNQQQSNQWFGADDGGDWSSSSSNTSADWGSSSSSDSGGWSGADSGGDWGGGSSDSGSTDW